MTKKEACIYEMYCNSSDTELRHVYKSWSNSKQHAFTLYRNDMQKHNGYDGRITSHTHDTFSYAFRYMAEDGEHLRFHTTDRMGYHTYDFLIDA